MTTSENGTRILIEQAHLLDLAHDAIIQNGTPVVVASRWVVSQDEHGPALAIVEISTDVTERKQEERARRLLADAGNVLATSLDATSRLANIAQVVVPLLADWCVVHITEQGQLVLSMYSEGQYAIQNRLID